MLLRRRGSAKSKHLARLQWLSANPACYVDVPGIHDDVTDANRGALEHLRTEMVARGLLGATTLPVQRETVRRMVSELRGEDVGGGW